MRDERHNYIAGASMYGAGVYTFSAATVKLTLY